MEFRKNIGIMLMMFGVLLTINQGEQQELFQHIERTMHTYWPLILSFVGIYLISIPKKKRK